MKLQDTKTLHKKLKKNMLGNHNHNHKKDLQLGLNVGFLIKFIALQEEKVCIIKIITK